MTLEEKCTATSVTMTNSPGLSCLRSVQKLAICSSGTRVSMEERFPMTKSPTEKIEMYRLVMSGSITTSKRRRCIPQESPMLDVANHATPAKWNDPKPAKITKSRSASQNRVAINGLGDDGATKWLPPLGFGHPSTKVEAQAFTAVKSDDGDVAMAYCSAEGGVAINVLRKSPLTNT